MTMIEKMTAAMETVNETSKGLRYTELMQAMARAALEAIQKPTSEMVEDPTVKRHMDSYSSNMEWWYKMVQAAIDGK